MSSRRLSTALISIVLAIGLVGFVPGSATARTSGSAVADRAATSASGPSARNVGIRISNRGPGFQLRGRVFPGGRKVRVKLLHSSCQSGCPVYRVRRTKTNRKGVYAFKRLRKVGYYQAVVPPSRGHGLSYSTVFSVVRR